MTICITSSRVVSPSSLLPFGSFKQAQVRGTAPTGSQACKHFSQEKAKLNKSMIPEYQFQGCVRQKQIDQPTTVEMTPFPSSHPVSPQSDLIPAECKKNGPYPQSVSCETAVVFGIPGKGYVPRLRSWAHIS